MYLKAFTAVFVLTISTQLSLGDRVSRAFLGYSDLMKALKYGDSCSWENEKIRQNFVQSYAEADTSAKGNLTLDFVFDTIIHQRKVCSATELLVCSKETQTCVCGSVEKSWVLQKSGSKGFAVEVEDNQKQCRWAEESYCFPPKEGKEDESPKCMQGTTCASKSDGRPCSFVTVFLYTLRNLDLGKEKITQDLYEGKICTCQAEKDLNNLGDKQTNFVSGRLQRVRAKREVNMDKDFDKVFQAAGVAPISDLI